MNTTFKAVDGHITENGAKHLANPDAVAIVGQEASTNLHLPCTIIPGHWAERIESGELLTEEEWNELLQVWVPEADISFARYVVDTIAAKLRGKGTQTQKSMETP